MFSFLRKEKNQCIKKVFFFKYCHLNVNFPYFSRRAFPAILTRRARAFIPTGCDRTAQDPAHQTPSHSPHTPALISTGVYLTQDPAQQKPSHFPNTPALISTVVYFNKKFSLVQKILPQTR